MKFKSTLRKATELGILIVATTTLILAGCGGGGGAAAGAGSITTIGGKAAAGAPIVGTVSAKDSKGTLFGPATIDVTGAYTLNVTGGVAPFILEATGVTAGTGNQAIYHSFADSTTMSGNINITPLTEMVVAQATLQSPAAFYTSCSTSCVPPTSTQVNTAQTAVNGSLGNLFAQFNVPTTGLNLITSTFVAGAVATQSAIDILLDAITVQPVSPTSFDILANANTGLPASTVLFILPVSATSAPLTVNPLLTASAVAAVSNAAATAVLGGNYAGTYTGGTGCGGTGTWQFSVAASGVLTGLASGCGGAGSVLTGTVSPTGTAAAGTAVNASGCNTAFTVSVSTAGVISGTWADQGGTSCGTLQSGTITGAKQSAVAGFNGAHNGTFTGSTHSGTWQITAANGILTGTSTNNVGKVCPITGVIDANGVMTSTMNSTSVTGCGGAFVGQYSPIGSPNKITGTFVGFNINSGTFVGN